MGKDSSSGNAPNTSGGNPMTQDAASRIQSTQATSGGDMSSGGFAARAQSAAARNENASLGTGQPGAGAPGASFGQNPESK
ncbi:MAG: hypothetical protein M1822_006110 [Bathelium mastoideum]|nr:MAG: hypothetical protein M1822_006110 [Bathelium mastoideum]